MADSRKRKNKRRIKNLVHRKNRRAFSRGDETYITDKLRGNK